MNWERTSVRVGGVDYRQIREVLKLRRTTNDHDRTEEENLDLDRIIYGAAREHADYLESVETQFINLDSSNQWVARRMAFILEQLPDGDGRVDSFELNRCVTAARREYPIR